MQRVVGTHPAGNRHGIKTRLGLLVPQEHGSWGMLITVLALPNLIFGMSPATSWITAAAVVLFLARRPLETLLHSGRNTWQGRAAWQWVWLLLPMGCIVAAAGVLTTSPTGSIIVLGLSAASLIAIGTLWEHLKQRGSFGARVVSVVGVTLFVPLHAAFYGADLGSAWALSVVILLFFLNAAIRVRVLLRARKSRWSRPIGFLAATLFLLGTIAWSRQTDLLPSYAGLALLPTTLQTWYALVKPERKVRATRIGIGEILHTAVFIAATGLIWLAR